jgi:hypothetical protein
MSFSLCVRVTIACLLVVAMAGRASGQEGPDVALEVEAAGLWQTRNDVRIPNGTGSKFSLVEAVGLGPYGATRVALTIDLNERHGVRFVYAPITVESRGTLGQPVRFAGELFDAAASTDATYQFNSIRVSYRYRIFDGPTWQWRLGGTLFVRDARIALRQGDRVAEDTDVGLVPLVNVTGEARLNDDWRFVLDTEALGAAQGRAIDLSTRLAYQLREGLELAAGYRTIEGGADVESVFNFAWLHFAVVSLRYEF